MKFKTLKGRLKAVDPNGYRIDWDQPSLSKFQRRVKEFLAHYWRKPGHVVCEEFPVAGSRMHFDFYHVGKRIAIECDGEQHNQYNKHFHRGSFSVFQMQLGRDDAKEAWCRLNEVVLVRIYEDDVPALDRAFFRKLGVEL